MSSGCTGEKPLTIDSKMPSIALDDFLSTENRFQIIKRKDPERYKALVKDAEYEIRRRRTVYEKLAEVSMPAVAVPTEAAE